MKTTHILFDCDNTLVQSEELAFDACADLANEILAKYGVPERYTGAQLLAQFVGQNFRGMLVGLQQKHNFQIPSTDLDTYTAMELGRVIAKLEAELQACRNCPAQVAKLHASGRFSLAVVSSSAKSRVVASLKKTGLQSYFSDDHVFSAATSLEKPTSKPDPAIYLYACKIVGVEPSNAVAIEDSKSGALAAVRAGIPTLGFVGGHSGAQKQQEMTQVLLQIGVKLVMQDWKDLDSCLDQVITK